MEPIEKTCCRLRIGSDVVRAEEKRSVMEEEL